MNNLVKLSFTILDCDKLDKILYIIQGNAGTRSYSKSISMYSIGYDMDIECTVFVAKDILSVLQQDSLNLLAVRTIKNHQCIALCKSINEFEQHMQKHADPKYCKNNLEYKWVEDILIEKSVFWWPKQPEYQGLLKSLQILDIFKTKSGWKPINTNCKIEWNWES